MRVRSFGGLLLLILPATSCIERAMPTQSYGFDCFFDFRAPSTECAQVRERRKVDLPALSEARELVLREVSAKRSGAMLLLDVRLDGRFHNDVDQNLYVFLGGPTPAPLDYALTSDPQYFADLSYPVRGSIALPHTNDVRIGLMAPGLRSYTPQVYVNDPVHADAVGGDAGITQDAQGNMVHVEIPLDRYFARRNASVPEALSVTVATARDYVGFIDQMTVRDIERDGAKSTVERATEPTLYPSLDAQSHVLERIAVKKGGAALSVEIEMAAPIRDWGQTNVHFLFFPVPPFRSASRLRDPSGSEQLPYKWSYYCGVYSPHRMFCKASNGSDFTFDTAYAERKELEGPEGVRFREVEGVKYALEMPADMEQVLRAGRATFAVMVEAGRDGFGPTTMYGASGTSVASP